MDRLGYLSTFLQRRPAASAALFLSLHTAIWTVFAVVSNDGSLHPDMTEAYGWGREFQLGYYKHPPFWAWIAGGWFKVFPREDWAFYLLATLNISIGFIGIWRLTGLFTQGPARLTAVLLLALLPFYTFQAQQFNANFMLVSLWPWTLYFFVRSMDEPKLRYGLWLGALGAAGLLSKYYMGLLLGACALASFAHPNWRRYYTSAVPYLAAAVCTLLVTPHIWWLLNNDFRTFQYLETRTAFATETVHKSILSFIGGCLAFNAVAIAIVAAARMLDRRAGQQPSAPPVAPDRQLFVIILALGPFVLTVIAGIAGHTRLSPNFASPILFLIPLLLLMWLRPALERTARITAAAAAIILGGGLLLSPAIPYLNPLKRTSIQPAIEIAREATRIWHEATAMPLRTVAGRFSMEVTFYSGDDTSVFTNFDVHASPWINRTRIEETGLLAICLEGDDGCRAHAMAYGGPQMLDTSVTVAHRLGGRTAAPVNFRLFIIPPTRLGGAAVLQ